ncbi:MAG: hypothetical protein IJZ51_06935 [Ruminiclostridium sp.]|nr:hypothetical protein [Ruminiclostridium sp.]
MDVAVIDDGEELFSYIADGLEKSFYVRRFTKSGLWASGEGRTVNMVLSNEPDILVNGSRIAVLGGISDYKRMRHRVFSCCIADSTSDIQMDTLLCSDFPVITCGCSAMDTFSYTSVTDDFLTVSLNRRLVTLSGRVVQPFELPRPFRSDKKIYNVLALTAVSLLLDDDNQEYSKMYS